MFIDWFQENGWSTDPVPGRIRINDKHKTVVGGFNYTRGVKDTGKEFKDISNLGIIAYAFNCEADGCRASILVAMKATNTNDGLSAIRSKVFHNHVPMRNYARVGHHTVDWIGLQQIIVVVLILMTITNFRC